jgi:hypothetical protein
LAIAMMQVFAAISLSPEKTSTIGIRRSEDLRKRNKLDARLATSKNPVTLQRNFQVKFGAGFGAGFEGRRLRVGVRGCNLDLPDKRINNSQLGR